MVPQTPDQKGVVDKAKPEKAPDKSVDTSKIAEELGRKQFEFKQQAETKIVGQEYQKDKATVQADLAAKRAEMVVAVGVPVDSSLAKMSDSEKAKVEALSAKAVEAKPGSSPESPTGQVAPNPAANPADSPAVAVLAAAPAAVPEKSFGEGIKEFFANLIQKIKDFFANFGKSAEEKKAIEDAKANPVVAPNASPQSVTPVETGNKGSWKEVANSEAQRLGIDPAFAMAIVTVEAGKKGLNSDGTPTTRFEAHVFNAQLAKQGINEQHGKWGSSKLSGRNVDGVSCEGGQANENACLQKAISINKEAAYNSISMGLGQVMGFNSAAAGYSSAENMYKMFSASGGGENEQIKGMFKIIENSPAHLSAARRKDFSAFTKLYNGPAVGTDKHSQYMAALQNAYRSNGGSSVG